MRTDEELAELVEGEAQELHRRNLRMQAAAQAPGFAGDLRRAIGARNPIPLAAAIGVDTRTLELWRAGEGELPGRALERLVEELGLHLVPLEVGR